MKLPVRFARILFLRSPGAVRARARRGACSATRNSSKAGSSLYDDAGQPCVLVDGFRAISVVGRPPRRRVRRHARRALPRRLGAHAAAACPASAGPPLPLAQLARRRRRRAGGSHRPARPSRNCTAPWPPATTSPPRSSRTVCARWASRGREFTADSLRVATPMQPVFERLMASLVKRGLLTKVAAGYPRRRRPLSPPRIRRRKRFAASSRASRPSARGAALRGKLRRTRPDSAR